MKLFTLSVLLLFVILATCASANQDNEKHQGGGEKTGPARRGRGRNSGSGRDGSGAMNDGPGRRRRNRRRFRRSPGKSGAGRRDSRPSCPSGYRMKRDDDSVTCINRTDRPVLSRASCESRNGRRCTDFACPEGEILKGRFCLVCSDGSTPTEDDDEKMTCPKSGADSKPPTCRDGYSLEGRRCVKDDDEADE